MSSPIKPTFKSEIVPLAMILISIPLSFYFYANFPERVASHWDFQGQVNGYGSRGFMAFFFPALIAGMYLLFLILPYFDPKRERYGEFKKFYHIFKALIITVMFAIYSATGLFNLGYPLNIGIIVSLLIGLMMIVMGKYMGEIKSNWFVGIRTPWTMSSETVWNKTHHVGGYLFMFLGLCIIVAPWLPIILATIIFIIGILSATVGTFCYSYWLYRQEQAKK
ncbi:MAG: SdpI family protein [bacterium]